VLTVARTLRPLTDLVLTSPYPLSATTGSGTLGSDTDAYREYITLGHAYRLQASGNLTQIKVAGPTTLTGQHFYLRIWRWTAANQYLLVDTTADLIGQITANQVSTVAISPAISVIEGDFVGYRLDGVGTTAWHGLTGQASVSTAMLAAATPATSAYPWESQTVTSGLVLPIETYTNAADLVVTGDSIVAGHPAHFSFMEATDTTMRENCLEFSLRDRFLPIINAGRGSETTGQIAARFATDVVAKKPRYVLINGGVNDIAASASTNTIVTNWTTMVNAAVAGGAIPILLLILPWTNGTTGQMQQRDTINGQLTTLKAATPGAILVDAGATIGVFRAGGDALNLWDIGAAYSGGDGVHFNALGYYTIAQAVLAAVAAS
jgi:lysophospholipase L1-like esterase